MSSSWVGLHSHLWYLDNWPNYSILHCRLCREARRSIPHVLLLPRMHHLAYPYIHILSLHIWHLAKIDKIWMGKPREDFAWTQKSKRGSTHRNNWHGQSFTKSKTIWIQCIRTLSRRVRLWLWMKCFKISSLLQHVIVFSLHQATFPTHLLWFDSFTLFTTVFIFASYITPRYHSTIIIVHQLLSFEDSSSFYIISHALVVRALELKCWIEKTFFYFNYSLPIFITSTSE